MIKKTKEKQLLVPPKEFFDYEWDEDFKLVMFCLEFTRIYFSGQITEEDEEELQAWGFKNKEQIYDLLWCRFKYFKGEAFDEKFSIVKSNLHCPNCKKEISFAEIKPIPYERKYKS